MSCSKEATEGDHTHGHGHGRGDGHGHSHDHDSAERGFEYSLYKYIEKDKVTCLNAFDDTQAQTIFRPWDERMSKESNVESDADEQLIINIPFTGHVSIKSIKVVAEGGEQHPQLLKVFGNRDDIDFDNVEELQPLQEIQMHKDPRGEIEYPTRASKFQNLHSLTLFFSTNYGGQTTKLYYIGFAGEHKQVSRKTVISVYEVNANPADHKVKDEYAPSSSIS
eukprot:CFRG2131T1